MTFTVTRLAYSDTPSGSNTVLTVPSALPIGTFLVALISTSGGGSTFGLTDSKSNTWTQRRYASNSSSPSAVVAIYTTTLTTALTTSDTLTGTSTAGSGCGDIMLIKVSVDAGTISVGSAGGTGTGTSTTPAVSSFTPGSGDLVIAALTESSALLNTNTTPGTGYTKLAGIDAHTQTRSVVGQYGVRSAVATTAPFTTTPSQNWAAAAITLVQSAPAVSGFVGEMARFLYSSTTTKTVTVPVTAAVAAGNYIVLAVNCPAGGGANTNITVTDTKSNTWTFRQIGVQATTGGNGQPALLTCPVTTPLTTSDTLTVTVNNFGAVIWAVCGLVFSGVTGYDVGASNAGANTSTENSGTTAAASQAAQVVVAAFGRTGSGETVTPAAGYTKQPVLETTGTIRALDVIWGLVNAAGTRTITATMGGSHAWAGAIVALNSVAPPAPTDVWHIWDSGISQWVDVQIVI